MSSPEYTRDNELVPGNVVEEFTIKAVDQPDKRNENCNCFIQRITELVIEYVYVSPLPSSDLCDNVKCIAVLIKSFSEIFFEAAKTDASLWSSDDIRTLKLPLYVLLGSRPRSLASALPCINYTLTVIDIKLNTPLRPFPHLLQTNPHKTHRIWHKFNFNTPAPFSRTIYEICPVNDGWRPLIESVSVNNNRVGPS